MLLFKCFCLYHRFERIFLSFLWFILMNAYMSTQLKKKFLQIYELFRLDQSVSKKFPMLVSPRYILDIFFQIYYWQCFEKVNNLIVYLVLTRAYRGQHGKGKQNKIVKKKMKKRAMVANLLFLYLNCCTKCIYLSVVAFI